MMMMMMTDAYYLNCVLCNSNNDFEYLIIMCIHMSLVLQDIKLEQYCDFIRVCTCANNCARM